MGLYIGMTTASAELADSAIQTAILHLAAAVADRSRRETAPEGPSMDLTFMLPGKWDQPDFTDMRMGGYTLEGNTLFFERPVPEHMIHSPKAGEYVALVVEDVLDNAEAFFRENAIDFDTKNWRGFVEGLAEFRPNAG